MKRTLAAASALLLSTALAWAQPPSWYTTHSHASYQPSRYLIGVGSADGSNAVEKAKKNAQVDLVSQIKVQVKGEMKNVTESFQLNKNESIYSDFTSQSRTIVNEEIPGIAIVETMVDPSTQTAYALASLDRGQYARSIEEEMNAAWNQASELRNSADTFLGKGKLSEALQSCAEARRLIVAVLPKKALHDAVAGKAYAAPNALTPVSLTTDMRTILAGVKLEKTEGDRQAGKIGSRFAKPLRIRALYGNVPLTGQPVLFESTDGVRLSETATDDKGEAAYAGCIRALADNIVRVKPALGALAREFDRSAVSSSAVFAYTPQPSDIGIEIAVTGARGDASGNVKAALASALGTIGYRIVPSSRYRIETALRPAPASKIEGMSGTLYTMKLEAVSTLVDKQSKAELGSLSSVATGGGKTESEAIAKASIAIRPDRMKLAELIEKIQQ